ncbi:MAG: PEP-CTERM sorting domain-containing protein [Bryobacteraceae bacterium]|nr:PEP-CTERM sorting domain-containing protein [Bryobacteraceae bacterium]
MNITRNLKVWVPGALLLMSAGSARGAVITYHTNGPGTGFAGTSLTLSSAQGQTATLEFVPNGTGDTGVPSNLNYGTFKLLCPSCSTQALGQGAQFDPFLFHLIISDTTHSATGLFSGVSSGGRIFSDVSPITVVWIPLELGPAANNALSGSFGSTVFQITSQTRIVAPNSGQSPGQTTVQGEIFAATDFPIDAVPEPGTLLAVGLGLVGLGVTRRRSLR